MDTEKQTEDGKMSRFDIYYAYQELHRISHLISQEEYRAEDKRLFAALKATY